MQYVFNEPDTIGANKWYISTVIGSLYLTLDGKVLPLGRAETVLFKTRELALKALRMYQSVIHIGGE